MDSSKTWVTKRKNGNGCYFCPPWGQNHGKVVRRAYDDRKFIQIYCQELPFYQDFPWKIEKKSKSDTLNGIQVRIRFHPENFVQPVTCDKEGFLFALQFKFSLPEDARVDVLGKVIKNNHKHGFLYYLKL